MLLLILVVSVGPARSQVVGGTVQGTLTDASGAVLASVKAWVVNLKTNALTTKSTNSNGFYTAPNFVRQQCGLDRQHRHYLRSNPIRAKADLVGTENYFKFARNARP